jgi:hypothetical protein
MAFATYGGKIELKLSGEALTPFGGLVPWAAFEKHTGILKQLAATCPVERTSPNAAPVYDVLCSFALTALCDGTRFNHVQRLREDPTVCEICGLKAVVGDDAIRRLFYRVDEAAGRAWVAAAARPIWSALPERIIQDWDSTVQTKYGHQEGAEVGYNPQKRGRRSFHPLLAVVAGTRLCNYYRWRRGDSATASEWIGAMEECQQWLGPAQRVWLNRGDMGFAQEKIMAWHELGAGRPYYLFKLKLTANVRRAIAALPESAWQGPASAGVLQVAEMNLKLWGWSQGRRVVVGRRFLGVIPAANRGEFWDQTRHEFGVYVTNLPAGQVNAWQVVELYRQRADTENVFDELKNQWGFNGFCTQQAQATALAARVLLLVYNLWNLFLRLLQPQRHVEARQGRRWFLLIAARLVHSGGAKAIQIAVQGRWWEMLKDGYQRVLGWLEATAPQLSSLRDLRPVPLPLPTESPCENLPSNG